MGKKNTNTVAIPLNASRKEKGLFRVTRQGNEDLTKDLNMVLLTYKFIHQGLSDSFPKQTQLVQHCFCIS